MAQEISLYDKHGQRLYLTPDERRAFLKAADSFPREVRSLCHLMAWTGCRISEALEMMPLRVDLANSAAIFRSLKKRNKSHWRSVPISPALLDMLDLVHNIRSVTNKDKLTGKGNYLLWPWSRSTAWRRIKEVMHKAGIEGAQATPKGLRHGFAIYALSRCDVPLNMLQKWLGHADIATTAIYCNALGEEEKEIASRMWNAEQRKAG